MKWSLSTGLLFVAALLAPCPLAAQPTDVSAFVLPGNLDRLGNTPPAGTDALEARLARANGPDRGPLLADLVRRYAEFDTRRALALADEGLALHPDPATEARLRTGKALTHYVLAQYDAVLAQADTLDALAEATGDLRARADALYLRAQAHKIRGPHETARTLAEQALEAYRQLGDRQGEGQALVTLAGIFNRLGDGQGQDEAARTAIGLFEALGDSSGVAYALFEQAIFMQNETHDKNRLMPYHLRSLAAADAGGNRRAVMIALANLAGTFVEAADYDKAIPLYNSARPLATLLGDQRYMARLSQHIGVTYHWRGERDQALAAYETALAEFDRIGIEPLQAALTVSNIGEVHFQQGRHDEALTTLFDAIERFEALGPSDYIVAPLSLIGQVYMKRGEYEEARGILEQARDRIQDEAYLVNVLPALARTYLALGRLDDALRTVQQSLTIVHKYNFSVILAEHQVLLGEVYAALERFDEALIAYQAAIEHEQRIGQQFRSLPEAHLARARLFERTQQPDSALVAAQASRALAHRATLPFVERDALDLLARLHQDRAQALLQPPPTDDRAALPQPSDADFRDALSHFQHALAAQQQFQHLSDSLFSADSESTVAELQQQYKTREQQQRIEILQQQRQLQRLWLLALIGGLALIAVIAALVYNRYRLKNKAHTQLSQAHHDLQTTHERLKTTQQQLVHTEKMAALGALTAGIAHEIKNPLNFVNNFALDSADLCRELGELVGGLNGEIAARQRGLLAEIATDLSQNSARIHHHGQRADAIVAAMMEHARTGSGRRSAVSLDGLVEEFVELTWHSRQASRSEGTEPEAAEPLAGVDEQGIHRMPVAVERSYGGGGVRVPVLPQEMGRVLMNLLMNAFDAVEERAEQSAAAGESYAPVVRVSTAVEGEAVVIGISDNGVGMSASVRAKAFEPFFTTKATGQGRTGLGLSLAYEIVVEGHGGLLEVESAEGSGTTFTVTLPINAPLPGAAV